MNVIKMMAPEGFEVTKTETRACAKTLTRSEA